MAPAFEIHAGGSQPPEFAPRDLWRDDIALREAVEREGAFAPPCRARISSR